jgi:hypothetical protein
MLLRGKFSLIMLIHAKLLKLKTLSICLDLNKKNRFRLTNMFYRLYLMFWILLNKRV